jgi:hypothetical protein
VNLRNTTSTSGGNARIKGGPAEPLQKSIERRLARVETLLAERHEGLPVWIRSPKSGTEHFTGLSRSKLYDGAQRGHWRSVSIREPGQIKGTRLFHLGSILTFIERHEAAAATEAVQAN